jgi:hypothetical protein
MPKKRGSMHWRITPIAYSGFTGWLLKTLNRPQVARETKVKQMSTLTVSGCD